MKKKPKKLKGKYKRRSITCTDDQWEDIQFYADKWGWSAAETARYMIFEYMDNMEQGEDSGD